jgi:hypothetical protein
MNKYRKSQSAQPVSDRRGGNAPTAKPSGSSSSGGKRGGGFWDALD